VVQERISAQQEVNITRYIKWKLLAWLSQAPSLDAIDRFHADYYNAGAKGGTWANTTYRGVTTCKCPMDMWAYQELIHSLRPRYIIETGTAWGGTSLYLADICKLIGHGKVLTVDKHPSGFPIHEHLMQFVGDSVEMAPELIKTCLGHPFMLILDSDHSKKHVAKELEAYYQGATYIIVEDTNVNGHPVFKGHGPGPYEAVDLFLGRHPERVEEEPVHLLSFNRYLKRL
jgi:cephalosporin hydroxylase